MNDDEPLESSKIPSTLPPEQVLEMLANELKHPLNSIEGWARILSDDEMRDQHTRAIDWILRWTLGIKQTLDDVSSYLGSRKKGVDQE